MTEDLRMHAYYYGFRPTGVIEIDKILSEVACAGKSYHSTEWWSDENEWSSDRRSHEQRIQDAADEAAKKFRHR